VPGVCLPPICLLRYFGETRPGYRRYTAGGYSVAADSCRQFRRRSKLLRTGRPPTGVVRWLSVGTQRLDFAEFYRNSRDECLRSVLVSVGDPDTAQDLVDEAFARACASWRNVSRHPAPAAWVVRTALNANISRWRRRRREIPVPDLSTVADQPAGRWAAEIPVDPTIMAALMGLPTRQRQVVALRLFLDLDTSATAEVLGIAPGTVKEHLARALASLRHDIAFIQTQETSS
jgi:RNA polymerase sigma-70 factor (sigma-E family)